MSIAAPKRSYAVLHEHLARLDAAGLLYRIEKPVNKDTQMHPLVRWQFRGGIAEEDRKAFLFTNIVDAKERRHLLHHLPWIAVEDDAGALGAGGVVEDEVALAVPDTQGKCEDGTFLTYLIGLDLHARRGIARTESPQQRHAIRPTGHREDHAGPELADDAAAQSC